MANTLFQSLKNIFVKKVDQANEAIQDNEADGKAAIKANKAKIVELQTSLHDILESTIVLQQELDEKQNDVNTFQAIAVDAKALGDITEVQTALINKKIAQESVDNFTAEIAKNIEIQQGVQDQLDVLEYKVQHAENTFAQLKVRDKSAQIREDVAKSAVVADSDNSLDSFEDAVNKKEASAKAWEKTKVSTNSGQALKDKYKAATGGVSKAELDAFMNTPSAHN